MEYNREFSHTILHKFNVMKNPKSEFTDITKEGGKESNHIKDSRDGRQDVNKESDRNHREQGFQKPIIKRDANTPANNKAKKNYHFDNNKDRNKDLDKEKEVCNVIYNAKDKDKALDKDIENLYNLKRNLMKEKNSDKDNNSNANNNLVSNNVKDNFKDVNNINSKEKNLFINPNIAFNLKDQEKENKRNVKSSLEIETNRTPKVIETKIPESKNINEKRNSADNKREKYIEKELNLNNLDKKGIKKQVSNNVLLSNKHEKEPINSKKNSEHNLGHYHAHIDKNLEIKENNSNRDSNQNLIQIQQANNGFYTPNPSSNNFLDRRRSESKSSQEDSKHEKGVQLKDFMKNMKERIKNNPPQIDGNVIWMRGMKEYVDKKDVVEKSVINQSNITTTNQSHSTPKDNKKQIKTNQNELREYIETQKMLMELERLQNGELEEENIVDINDINPNDDDLINEFREIGDELMENNYFYSEELAIKNKANAEQESLNGDANTTNTALTNTSIENMIRNDVENEIGKEVFNKVYKILYETINDQIICFEYDNLNKKIKEECSEFDETAVDLALQKIPDIYCLVLKDRKNGK